MVEPTESEQQNSIALLKRWFASQEADKIAAGEWPQAGNPLVNAPHTLADITDAEGTVRATITVEPVDQFGQPLTV